ncbi:hypothetical protein G849_00009, partial [Escherichia coli HVH 197 (4-4466217)]
LPADILVAHPQREQANDLALELIRQRGLVLLVNATMFDRYLPFSCPLRYFRY